MASPIFNTDARYGGVVNDYPLMASPWSGNQLGDLLVGAKVNLLSESRQQPVAFALRGVVKLPDRQTMTRAPAPARRTSSSTRLSARK